MEKKTKEKKTGNNAFMIIDLQLDLEAIQMNFCKKI